ncbi:hypothetical protein M0638_24705 [Roseomonas sp. NAR14]|uniref:Uncharacterized protein n=1 Tax=Roseomonas acroporae TaxID=2937791 RepID=A0A9X2BXR8_9PROT|nr:hypothetical protein [Roseomonas acroporae]MCK8787571.1 hypothetical protein [Roseomonas acroporae]
MRIQRVGGDIAVPPRLSDRVWHPTPAGPKAEIDMCIQCAGLAGGGQARILDLLDLLEEPGTLPAGLALRLGREIWALTRGSMPACETVAAPEVPAHE